MHKVNAGSKRLSRRDLAWAAACLILSIGSYELLNHVPRSTPLNLATDLDKAIPLLPVFVIPYLSFLPLVFAFVPVLLRQSPELFRSYFLAMLASQMVMNIFYLVVPATVPRPPLSSNDVFSVLLRDLVWQVDNPVNTFPSNHVTFSVIAILVLTRCLLDNRLRLALQIWFGVICLSTLLVHQHVIADVVSGVLLGVGACWFALRVSKRPRQESNLRPRD